MRAMDAGLDLEVIDRYVWVIPVSKKQFDSLFGPS